MSGIRKIAVSTGIFLVEIAAADLRLLCGCPSDAVKHLKKKGLILGVEVNGVKYETGPNAILVSDLAIQNGRVCNRAEFPVLQMLYLQGMILPDHPNNTGELPLLVGARQQVEAQMAYIFRGNYGLASIEEMIAAGATPELADELMRMKLAFAFGRIRPSEELLQPVYLGDAPAEIRNGVTVTRTGLNVFRIAYKSEHVDVDLMLAPGDTYECPYRLEKHLLQRDYFSVVHSGDGDGWDINRPAMGSIVLFQGKVYLIDAGPNIQTSLDALGIGVNEIDGVFSTHCHDDHFAGLTQLIRSDRRLKYYAVPLVRVSIEKKLAAVLGAPELEVRDLFDVQDLKLDEWNDVDGLGVLPFLSPHPVETTCLRFRVFWEGGYRTYAHLADIASLDVLEKMVTGDAQAPGISIERFERTKREYAERADIKKIDIGGGPIHGQAADFRGDASGRLILAHTDRVFTEEERTIGSGAPFSTIDVLIEAVTNPLRRKVFEYLRNYFPDIALSPIRHLMNNKVVTFNPEMLIIKQGEPVTDVLLILTGNVEMLRPDEHRGYTLFGGALLGEISILQGDDSDVAYRAVGFVQALRIPGDLYRDFVERNALFRSIVQARQESNFLRRTWLFAEGVSAGMLNKLVLAADVRRFEAEATLTPPDNELLLIQSGSAKLEKPNGRSDLLKPGDHFGARALGGQGHRGSLVRFLETTEAYALPAELTGALPIVRWKLIETYRRRYLDVH
jgi:hemerythrin